MTEAAQVKLETIMASANGSVDPSNCPEEAFDLYSIPAFDNGEPDVVNGRDIGSTKQLVQPGDVLLSKIVPHIRRAWVVGQNRGRRLIASSEWIVFRSARVEPRYLRHALVCEVFHAHFLSTVSGVGGSLMRARPAHVAKIMVPLPSLSEQRRIADILDKAYGIRRKRLEGINLSRLITEGAFSYLFGDTWINDKHWPQGQLEDLCSKIVDCPHSTPDYSSSPTGCYCVRSSGIQKDKIDLLSTLHVSKAVFEERVRRHTPIAGEVVYTREGGRLGNAAQIPPDVPICLGQRMMLFSAKPMESTNEFIWALLNSPGVKRQVRYLTAGAAAPRINIADIRVFKVVLPPYKLQQQYSQIVSQVRDNDVRHAASASACNDLFNSLVQRAFRGEL